MKQQSRPCWKTWTKCRRSPARDAITLLGNIGNKGAVDKLREILSNPNDNARIQSAEALGKLRDPLSLEPLLEALNTRNTLLQETAANALGELGDRRAADALADKIHLTGKIWQPAVYALTQIKDSRAVEPLVELTAAEGKDEDGQLSGKPFETGRT